MPLCCSVCLFTLKEPRIGKYCKVATYRTSAPYQFPKILISSEPFQSPHLSAYLPTPSLWYLHGTWAWPCSGRVSPSGILICFEDLWRYVRWQGCNRVSATPNGVSLLASNSACFCRKANPKLLNVRWPAHQNVASRHWDTAASKNVSYLLNRLKESQWQIRFETHAAIGN